MRYLMLMWVDADYVDQSRRGTFLDGRQLSGPLRITESVVDFGSARGQIRQGAGSVHA